ncbi:MAG: class I SAM-dependent methyltransferase [Verrucomicrobiota bacterium]|nr:class I SAM-dependent methyltransferase [Verrucomicrobiota bacterium]
MKASLLVIFCPTQKIQAQFLADQFSIPIIDGSHLAIAKPREIEGFVRSIVKLNYSETRFVFMLSDLGLSLSQITEDNLLSIRADFYSPSVNYRRQKGGGKGQMIARAIGLNSLTAPYVLDATAGLGGDAFVLASLGCPVTMVERVPEVHALLDDGLRVAGAWGSAKDQTLIAILKRMTLVESDAAKYMQTLEDTKKPEVVYLDPMFPLRAKSAQVKKEMHVLQQLIGKDVDADLLLQTAQECAQKRVVVKRPRIAPFLAGLEPNYTLEGRSNRYDVYLNH